MKFKIVMKQKTQAMTSNEQCGISHKVEVGGVLAPSLTTCAILDALFNISTS